MKAGAANDQAVVMVYRRNTQYRASETLILRMILVYDVRMGPTSLMRMKLTYNILGQARWNGGLCYCAEEFATNNRRASNLSEGHSNETMAGEICRGVGLSTRRPIGGC